MSGIVSYAQHGEDVVIWRALKHVPNPFYVDVGAADPSTDSVTRSLYERGWRGIHVEALSEYAQRLREARPEDVVVEAAAGAEAGELTFYGVPGTGLSTTVPDEASVAEGMGFEVTAVTVPVRTVDDILAEHVPAGQDIHVLKVDVEGAEEAVLTGAGLSRWRPWVVVVEATRPNSTERTSDRWRHLVLEAGYVECMFDGLNLWFRRDDLPELADPLSYPACPLDYYRRATPPGVRPAAATGSKEVAEAKKAQAAAERKASEAQKELARTRRRLADLQASPWWRMTRPARSVVHRSKKALRKRQGPVAAPAPTAPVAPEVPAPPPPAPADGTPREVVVARLRELLAADGLQPVPVEEQALRDLVLERLSGADRARWAWALHVVHTGSFADDLVVDDLLGLLDLEGPDVLLRHLQQLGDAVPHDRWNRTARLDVVSGPLVDVTHTATNDLHTGIQRVVRETVSRWSATHDCQLVVVDGPARTMRRPHPLERARVVAWPPDDALRAAPAGVPDAILLPWRTTLVIGEVTASIEHADLLRGLAAHSGNEAGAVVYDLIPLMRAENVPAASSGRFARYVSFLKHVDRVSAISATVAREFDSCFGALDSQGLAGPAVRPHTLPTVAGGAPADRAVAVRAAVTGGSDDPVVLSVSTFTPRKNHLRTLEAAERLWAEGVRFQLVFISGYSSWTEFHTAVEHLVAKGRPIRVLAEVDDDTLWEAYRVARCSVFVSLVEGYGLPAAESLAVETPVVLTRYGSMAEIGAPGGALLVDPRDVGDIASALRTLLTDDARYAELRAAAAGRTFGTWDDYARECWDWLFHAKDG